jgi:hypothetical protein
MLSLILAALLQATPEAATAPRDNGLPKDDYSLVAWCHGALAGQLELDPVAKADMEKIEGKAKVAARAKADAELEAERRVYLKDYEHALSAAEAASPTNIHQTGVQAELQGYRLWAATRAKEPIWRMLDWGMWDPNDVGCGDAAKRLYNKASLFGEALRASPSDARKDEPAKAEPAAAPLATPEAKTAADASPTAAAPGEATEAAAKVDKTPPPAEPVKKVTRTTKASRTAKSKTKPASSGEDIRAAIAAGKAETAAQPAEPAKDAPAPASDAKSSDPGLRGPQ